jgi:transposase
MSVCRASGGNTTPVFREKAARLVIETGRPVAHVAAEIGVGEQVLGHWVRLQRKAASAGDLARC